MDAYLYMAGICIRMQRQKERNMFQFMNRIRLYGSNKKLIHPRIAKLLAKEK
jgi:hypothetical protein